MKYIKRNKSVVTHKANLEHLYTFKSFPAYMGCVSDINSKNDITANMSFCICRDSGIIQLDKVLPTEIVYSHEHSDGVGKIWNNHYIEFSKFISQISPINILEIGGGNCLVADLYLKKEKNAQWTIVEPNPINKSLTSANIIQGWYDNDFKTPTNIDAIVHSHVFEHMYDPCSFLKKINSDLKVGGKHIFSIPDLYELLKNQYTNALNFEHTIFLSEYFVDYFLVNTGFKILKKKRYLNHSIFYATEKVKYGKKTKYVSKYLKYKKLFNDFISAHEELIKKINKQMLNLDCDIYLFGGHIFSQYLIKFGLDTSKIIGILDNSDIKKGKRLYGTSFFVNNPSQIKNLDKVAVIIRAAGYQFEVKSQILDLNKKTIIIE